jgi:hypothetical protein
MAFVLPESLNIKIILYLAYALLCAFDVFVVFQFSSAKEQLIIIIGAVVVFIVGYMIPNKPEIFRVILTGVMIFGIAGILDFFFGEYVIKPKNTGDAAKPPQDAPAVGAGSTGRQETGNEDSNEDSNEDKM